MNFRPRSAFIISLVLGAIVGGTFSAHYLWQGFVGLDPSAFPAGETLQSIGYALFPALDISVGGLVLALGTILVVGILSGIWVFRSWRTRSQSLDPSRRSLLKGGAAGAGAAVSTVAVGGGVMFARTFLGWGHERGGWNRPLGEIFGGQVVKTHPEWKEEWKGSRVASYGRLGRTEWPVSDTVLGTGRLYGEKGTEVVKVALERGVNYIDTSPDYSGSGSELAVGEALASVPRDSVFLATKFCTPDGHLPADAPVARYKEVIDESLARLGTDYVDLVHVHSCDDPARLLSPNMHAAFRELRDEGKVRFLGFSSHTPNLPDVANAAIDSGQFDVMMLAYHHGVWPGLSDVIHRAVTEQDMGVVAMKTLKGGKHQNLAEFQDESDSYAQAALKWVHSDPDVSCAVISFFEYQHVDEYLYASGKTPDSDEIAMLEKYDRLTRDTYCSPHCGECLSSCPQGVPINDILRHRMYFEDYGAQRKGMELYARLERNASLCSGCPAPCESSCPVGISIKSRLEEAHAMLTLV